MTTSRSSAMLEAHRRREDDEREDAFLEACGAVYGRHRLRVAFTAGLGRYAKKAQDWKRTIALADERHGAGDLQGAAADAQRRDPGEGERARAASSSTARATSSRRSTGSRSRASLAVRLPPR